MLRIGVSVVLKFQIALLILLLLAILSFVVGTCKVAMAAAEG